ncbi:hypothetical protein ACB094_06G040600 [Castanea mollissima]
MLVKMQPDKYRLRRFVNKSKDSGNNTFCCRLKTSRTFISANYVSETSLRPNSFCPNNKILSLGHDNLLVSFSEFEVIKEIAVILSKFSFFSKRVQTLSLNSLSPPDAIHKATSRAMSCIFTCVSCLLSNNKQESISLLMVTRTSFLTSSRQLMVPNSSSPITYLVNSSIEMS